MKKFALIITIFILLAFGPLKENFFDLANLANINKLKVINRNISVEKDSFGNYIKISEQKGEGIVWLPIKNFKNGSIEVEMRGKDVLQRSFIGLVFHAQNDSIFDAVYCRPFNFFAKDSVRRIHAIQYVSHPKFTWKYLRETRNAEFEKEIQSPPNPNNWFKMKLVIKNQNIQAFINNSKVPSLVVHKISNSTNGKIGIFTGDYSGGDFRNIRIKM